MKYLIDQRESITVDDIDQAQYDARNVLTNGLENFGTEDLKYLIERLAAIVENTYGEPT